MAYTNKSGRHTPAPRLSAPHSPPSPPSPSPSAPPDAETTTAPSRIEPTPSLPQDSQRKLPEAHASATELFENMFEQAAIGMAHSGLDGRWLRVNHRLCEITGYSREELLACTWQDITHPDDLKEDIGYADALHAGAIPHYIMDKRFIRKDGSSVWVTIMISLVRANDGAPAYHVCVVDDISHRKRDQAEQSVLLAHERGANRELRALQAITDTALTHLDLDDLLYELVGRIRDVFEVDNAAIFLLDEQANELRMAAARGIEEMTPMLHVPVGMGFVGRIAASRAPLVVDDLKKFKVFNPMLREQVRSAVGVPLELTGRLLGVMHVGCATYRHFEEKDVSLLERVAVRAAQAIERAELYDAERMTRAALDAVVETMPDAAVLFGVDGKVLLVNTAFRELFTLDERPGFFAGTIEARRQLLEIRDTNGKPLLPEHSPFERVLRNGETLSGARAMDIQTESPDGRLIDLEVVGSPVHSPNGDQITGAVLLYRDVTERRRLERRTRAALDAMLQMAEALVAPPTPLPRPGTAIDADHVVTTTPSLARRLAQLACEILGADRVSMHALDPDTQAPIPLAVAGLPPEQERDWFNGWPSNRPLRDTPVLNEVADCSPGEVRVINLTQPPYSDRPVRFEITELALAPMYLADQVVGVLSLDHGGAPHTYTRDEMALIGAVAKLGAVIIERERLLREREAARAEALVLEAANQRMDEFLSIASHELRTPLTTIKMNVQLVDRQIRKMLQQGDGQLRNDQLITLGSLISRTENAIERQQRLVDDLLDVSRMQSGKLNLRLQQTNFVDIVRSVIDEQQLANPKRMFTFDLPSEPAQVESDPDRIRQAVTNYLTNAVKYSDPSQPVAIRVYCEGADVIVEVKDRGLGLAPSELDRVWERFYRSSGVTHRSGSAVGLGLGLHISREIVELHGGRVGVQSQLEVGSTFWFALPLIQHEK